MGHRTRKSERRDLFDPKHPQFDGGLGFIRYPFYRVMEAVEITGIQDDKIRSLFRSGDYGEVVEIYAQKPGRRAWKSLLIPIAALLKLVGK